jgi:hypothetical protein
MKTCTTCKKSKKTTAFQKDAQTSDGLCVYCKPCRAEKLRQRTPHRRAVDLKNMREWRQNNAAEVRAKKATTYADNAEKVKASVYEYRRNNKAKIKIASRLRYLETKVAMRPTRAQNAASRKKRTPKWLTDTDRKAMISIYETCAMLTKTTGTKHEVDHILPLQGEYVSGFHVPANLQILTQFENRSKGNRV